MANYVEYIKVGTGESWQVRDADAQSGITRLENSVNELATSVEASLSKLDDSVSELNATVFKTTGGTMSGDVDMNGNAITGLPEPTNDSDPATKEYVDSQLDKSSSIDTVVSVEANTEVTINLQEGDVINFMYCSSYTGDAGVTLLVNSLNPNHSSYHYGSENWTNKLITQCGATCPADFTGTMRVLNGRVHLHGSGLRGNGSGIGHAAMQWNDVINVETLTFSQAGSLAYRKL